MIDEETGAVLKDWHDELPLEPASDADDKKPKARTRGHAANRSCERCGVGLTEENYGGWFDVEAHPFSQPRRFYLCRDCGQLAEAAEKRKKAKEEMWDGLKGLVVLILLFIVIIYAIVAR